MALSKIRQAVRFAIQGEAPPVGDAPVINYTINRTSGPAPFGVLIDATSTTSTQVTTPFDELTYSWNYGDIGSTFDNRVGVDANVSRGPIGGHVFESIGSNTITLYVMDNDLNISIETINITVEDPEVVYDSNTYWVSTSGTFPAGTDPSKHLNSYEEFRILEASGAFSKSVANRVLFRRGETFEPLLRTFIEYYNEPFHIGSYDVGDKPFWDLSGMGRLDAGVLYFVNNAAVTVDDTKIVGDYDPTTGYGNIATGIFAFEGSENTLIHKSEISGVGIPFYPEGGTHETGRVSRYQMVADCKITDWQNFGVFGTFGYLGGIIGSSIKQNINAVSGSEGSPNTEPDFPDHGPMRLPKGYHMLIQHNDLFNNCGWSSAGLAHQPCVRLGTSGVADQCLVADNLMEGGFSIIEMLPENAQPTSSTQPHHTIIERNELTCTSNTADMMHLSYAGLIIRNNIYIKPNNGGPLTGPDDLDSVIQLEASNSTPENLALTIKIYSNTFICLEQNFSKTTCFLDRFSAISNISIHNNIGYMPYTDDDVRGCFLRWQNGTDLSSVAENNNILYAPLLTSYTVKTDISDYSTLSEWQLTGQGLDSKLEDPLFVNTASLDGLLQVSSPAIDEGVEIQGLTRDYYNNDRTVNAPDIGATEYTE